MSKILELDRRLLYRNALVLLDIYRRVLLKKKKKKKNITCGASRSFNSCKAGQIIEAS